MTHHGVKQITLSPFGQEIVCGNRTVHRWISEEPNFDTGYSVPTVNFVYSSGACRTGPHLAHAKANRHSSPAPRPGAELVAVDVLLTHRDFD